MCYYDQFATFLLMQTKLTLLPSRARFKASTRGWPSGLTRNARLQDSASLKYLPCNLTFRVRRLLSLTFTMHLLKRNKKRFGEPQNFLKILKKSVRSFKANPIPLAGG